MPGVEQGIIHMDSAACPPDFGASSSMAATSNAGAYSPLFTNSFSPFMVSWPSTVRTCVLMLMVSEPAEGSDTANANAKRPVC